MKPLPFDQDAYLLRIKLVRKLTGKNQMEFAEYLGIHYKSWNHYECGHVMLPPTALTLLRDKVRGLSLDWLYYGDLGKMPSDLHAELQRLERLERQPIRKLSLPPQLPRFKESSALNALLTREAKSRNTRKKKKNGK